MNRPLGLFGAGDGGHFSEGRDSEDAESAIARRAAEIPEMPMERTARASTAKLAEQRRYAELIARMARADEAALGELYDATVGRVYGFALRIVGNTGAAEEIASDVFLQAWKDAGRYDAARAKVLTWLLMICRSRALDWLRGRDPEVLHDEPERLLEELPAGDAPQDLLEATESTSAVHAALARLTPVQRQLVSLAFFRGLSHQEIADHARMPLGTVKSHIRRALDALRELLGADGLSR